ncbi:MAG: murein biosynthesis integral membrane protein MurJ [bacterium]
MIKKLLNNQSKTITSAAILLGIATFASKFLGFVKTWLLASTFGAGAALDAYYVAISIPEFVFNLLVVGAISASFIPIFLEYHSNKKETEAWDFMNGVLNLLTLVVLIISALFIIFAPQAVKLVAPGFREDSERFRLAVPLMRMLFITPVIFGISSVMSGAVRSFKKFLIYALAPILYNVGIIIGALFFSKYWGIFGVALGVILGSFMHLSIETFGAISSGFKYKFVIPLKHKGIQKLFKLMIPNVMGIASDQVNGLIFTLIASKLMIGDITIFNFADTIRTLPIGIFALSFAVASFPTIADLAAKKDWDNFISTISGTARQILFWMIPSAIILYALRAQLVRVVVGAKGFSWSATQATAQTVGYFAIGICAAGLAPLLSRAFFSLHDTITPFFTGLCGMAVSVVAGFILAKKMGVPGLGLAFIFAAIIDVLLQTIILRKKLGRIEGDKIFIMLIKIFPAGAAMAFAMQKTKYFMANKVNMQTFKGVITQGTAAGIAGITVYCAVCLALRCEEMVLFKDALVRRMKFRKPVQIQDISSDLDE